MVTSPQGQLLAKDVVKCRGTQAKGLTVSAAGEVDILPRSKDNIRGKWEEEEPPSMAAMWILPSVVRIQISCLHSQRFVKSLECRLYKRV